MHYRILLSIPALSALMLLQGCTGYSNSFLHRQDISTVYVEMFDTDSFYRGYEYTLTDAICKHIEARSPYKIVSDRDLAESVLSGSMKIGQAVLSGERETGMPLERETSVAVTITWKNLKTGQLLIDRQTVYGSAGYSTQLGQSFDYAIARSVNEAAQRVVESMEQPW